MNHGVQFKVNNVVKHSADDWGLILSPFDIPTADVKTSYVDIEGGDGSIDLSDVFGITYKDLSFTLKFTLKDGDYNNRLRQIKAFLHGQVAKITLYNDDGYYYEGRCIISDFKSSKAYGTISVDVTAKPYKFKQQVTEINETIEGTKTVVFKNDSMKVVPTFQCSADMRLTFNNNEYQIGTSSMKIPDIIFVYGDNQIVFTGNGTVKVTYQEGAL